MPNQYTDIPKRPIISPIGPSIAYIPLTRGLYALIESDDSEIVSQYNWQSKFLNRGEGLYYAVTWVRHEVEGKQKFLMMHRLLLNTPLWVDHKNRATLDNRRHANLREATPSENSRNRRPDRGCGIKGVSFNRQIGKWHARIALEGRRIHLGFYATKEEASAARKAAEAKYHGEFAFKG